MRVAFIPLTCGGYICISICHNGLWRFLHDLSLHWLDGILPKLLRLFSILDLNVTQGGSQSLLAQVSQRPCGLERPASTDALRPTRVP